MSLSRFFNQKDGVGNRDQKHASQTRKFLKLAVQYVVKRFVFFEIYIRSQLPT